MKNILALDTSADTFSIAILESQPELKLLAHAAGDQPRQHLVELFPCIERVLRESQTELSDLAFLAVTSGPGSFTGVRLGVLVARSLAQVHRLPIASVNVLEALAYQAQQAHPESGSIVVAIDARKDQILSGVAKFAPRKSKDDKQNTLKGDRSSWMLPVWISEPQLYSPTQWIESLPNGSSLAVGSAGIRYGEQVLASGRVQKWCSEELNRVQASSVGALGHFQMKLGQSTQWGKFLPYYVRPADALPLSEQPGRSTLPQR
jgi:tRNA threonylcarbamoyl adenosine modification protein YeaZ